MKFPEEAARLGVLQNAVVSELLNRVQAAGNPDAYKHAGEVWAAAIKRHGYLKGDQVDFPVNIALMVFASK